MSLSWDSSLDGDDLTLFNDQWSDISPTTYATAQMQMPNSNVTRSSSSEAEDSNNFGTFIDGNAAGSFFDDTLFANNSGYLIGDNEVLQPFGDYIAGGGSTSESSPEPTTSMSPTDYHVSSESSQRVTPTSSRPTQSPPSQPTQRLPQPQSKTLSNLAYESLFPNNLNSGFVEDLTFPGGPNPINAPKKPSTESSNTPAEGATTVKRTKADADILSACWTSPLCPNNGPNGEIPNPANCGGGCAPFLFASEDTLPTPTVNSFPIAAGAQVPPQEVFAEDGIVEIQPRSRKRNESGSSELQGRQFPSRTSPDIESKVKSEKPSPAPTPTLEEKEAPAKEGAKPKPRRRLPHNQVERKYRESLNTQLDSLLRVVPSLQQNQLPCDGADIEDLPAPTKPSKAIILASATAYIKQMEKDKKNLADENQLLRTRVKALQQMFKCDDCSLMQYVMDLKINPGQT